MLRFTAQKVFYISLEPETRVQPWPCLLRGRKPRDLVEGQNPLPEMRTEQPVQNLPLSSNTPFSGLSFLPVSQEPSLAWTLSTQSPQKGHLPSHWTQGVGGSLSVFSGPQCSHSWNFFDLAMPGSQPPSVNIPASRWQ